MSKMHWAVFLVMASLSLSAAIFIGGCSIHYPSCGQWRQRTSDGAYCRECITPKERYAQCATVPPI